MSLKQALSFFVALLLFQFSSGQSFDYLPTSTTGTVVDHKHFSLSYSEAHEQSEWVAYRLTKESVKGNYERTDNYRADPKISSGSASLSDFKGSGYDRGHLAPAKAMAFSSTAMSQSFYLSNMSPQDASFNRGIWVQLEKQVRQWTHKNEAIYVVTGPVLNQCKEYIGPNNVCVPKAFYKVILDYQYPNRKAIAFVLPNKKGKNDLQAYAVSIDDLESTTGINFFHNLPNQTEKKLEHSVNTNQWDFNTNTYTPSFHQDKKSSAKRCKGITQKGERCERRTKSSNQYCWQHDEQESGNTGNQYKQENNNKSSSVRCKGQTNDGDRCKRMTKNSSGYCWQHE